MTYWQILDALREKGRISLRTQLTGGLAGHKTIQPEPYADAADAFCETLQRQPRLFVFGGGHVGAALIRLASYTDFELYVIDQRPEFADPGSFPEGVTPLCMPYEQAFERIRFLPSDYLAIMTPGHDKDQSCALLACRVEVAYRGMMGSKAKVAITKDKLRQAGISQALIDSLHAPIGLPISAQTPVEIAVSILAEIIQLYRQSGLLSLETQIVEALDGLRGSGEGDVVMCTIVSKRGSGPRAVGTRMLVGLGGGLLAGTIGGGEVEAHALRRAALLLEQGDGFALERYHMSAEAAASIGMVCGGSADVMFERLTPPDA